MVGMACGLANAGKIPFVAAAACFLTARPLEQIKNDLAYSNMNVKLCGVSTGLAYGALGSTHHSIEDIAWMRSIANMKIVVPADPVESERAVEAAAETYGPIYLRFSRMGVPIIHDEGYQFQFGKAGTLRDGDDVTLIACGTMVTRALQAADLLEEEGVEARVLNMASIKPIDRDAIVQAAEETGAIVTAEEHQIYGGLGGAVAEVVVATRPVPMRILGVPGDFAPSAEPEFLFEYLGLTAIGIRDAALEILELT
jgi:transketolase